MNVQCGFGWDPDCEWIFAEKAGGKSQEKGRFWLVGVGDGLGTVVVGNFGGVIINIHNTCLVVTNWGSQGGGGTHGHCALARACCASVFGLGCSLLGQKFRWMAMVCRFEWCCLGFW